MEELGLLVVLSPGPDERLVEDIPMRDDDEETRDLHRGMELAKKEYAMQQQQTRARATRGDFQDDLGDIYGGSPRVAQASGSATHTRAARDKDTLFGSSPEAPQTETRQPQQPTDTRSRRSPSKRTSTRFDVDATP